MQQEDNSLSDVTIEVKKSPTGARASAPPPVPKTVRGQRYEAPVGRHSQKTHVRAQERAAAAGHATETEQHAHDRSMVVSQMNDRTQQKQEQQRKHSEQATTPKSKAQPDSPGQK